MSKARQNGATAEAERKYKDTRQEPLFCSVPVEVKATCTEYRRTANAETATEMLQSSGFYYLRKEKTMRLNKKGKPYIEPNPPQPYRVRSKDGLIYSATKAPDGLCRCGIMLELKPSTKDYIFPTSKQATHAVSHTLKFLASIGVESGDKFILEKVK